MVDLHLVMGVKMPKNILFHDPDYIYLSAKNFAKLSTISFHYLNAIAVMETSIQV